tara:strand:+ start:4866 stop:5078 length:213 start_codon:yes stop_codon:yes gene_type:complete
MPTLNSHTHCQAAQASRTNPSLSKSVSEPTHGQKKKKHESTTKYKKHEKSTTIYLYPFWTTFLLDNEKHF